ncbi:MAG TPA: aminotransferase class I/II-fold pyridoxal phosphate-dependent enzyme, partial [Flavihumibacter sp.]
FGQIEPIVVSSLAKAMGLPGGLILASEVRMQNFRRSPYYTAASPMAPAYLHAYLHADAIYEEERTHLYNSIKYFREHLGQIKGIRSLSDYPVFACSHSGLAEYLYQRKILISSFSYPKPTDDVITRIILNSHHTQSDLDQLLHALHDNPHTVHDK